MAGKGFVVKETTVTQIIRQPDASYFTPYRKTMKMDERRLLRLGER